MRRTVQIALSAIDRIFAAVSPGLIAESPSLIAVLFHGLYKNRSDADSGDFDPQQRVTVDDFRRFLDTFLEAGYSVITPDVIVAGLKADCRYLIVTFDDGYFNNSFAADVLADFHVPATFFISTNHVTEGKGFWWDALYRLARQSGATARQRHDELRKLKQWKTEDVERYMTSQFGPTVLRPSSDLDRPFTPDELRDFSRRPLVHLGNHTSDHAILTNYPREQIATQIRGCQTALQEMAGYSPAVIAYPNGNVSNQVVDVARSEGLSVGFSLRPHKNVVPLEPEMQMTLGRFILWGGSDVRGQCAVFRSEFAPTRYLRRLNWGYGSS